MRVAGAPLAGVRDRWEEMALLFADAAAQDPAFRAFGELRRRAIAAGADVDRLNAEIAKLAEKERELAVELRVIRETPLVWTTSNPLFWVLLLLLGLSLFLQSRERKKRAERIHAATSARTDVQAAAASARERLEAQQREVESLQVQLRTGAPPRTLRGVGRAYLPLRRADLAGYPVVVDRSGLVPSVTQSLPDLAADPVTIDAVRRDTEAARAVPVLLDASETSGEDTDAVAGEEVRLERALSSFVRMIQSVPVVQPSLRLVPRESPLAARIADGLRDAPAADAPRVPGIVLESPDRDATDRDLRALGEMAGRLRTVGTDVGRTLAETRDQIRGILATYSDLRNDAIDHLHDQLLGAMRRSPVAQVRYYCPKCCAVPEYLFHRLGVAPDDAHLVPQHELVARLAADAEIATRLQRDPTILPGLEEAHTAVCELQHALSAIEAQDPVQAAAVGGDVSARSATANVAHAHRSQLAEALKTYRRWFRLAVTGSDMPLLSLPQQARMQYDPRHGAWTCPACESSFEDGSTAEMGRLLRIKEELVHPIWQHLWMEKDDFKKAEQFATDREMGVMNEKESEKLLLIATQYTDDVRMVREHLILASAEAESRAVQVDRTLAQLVEARLLSAADADSFRTATGGKLDVAALKKHAAGKEIVLKLEPQAQLARRPVAADPVQTLASPASLFRAAPQPAPHVAAPHAAVSA